jgi:hypothetical protein
MAMAWLFGFAWLGAGGPASEDPEGEHHGSAALPIVVACRIARASQMTPS